MPQLDFLIISSQVAFVFFFILGYFLFIKTTLPLISSEMKLKNKKLLNNMKWLKVNLPKSKFVRFPFSKFVSKTRGMLNSIDIIVAKKNIFFGIYKIDLYYIKHRNLYK